MTHDTQTPTASRRTVLRGGAVVVGTAAAGSVTLSSSAAARHQGGVFEDGSLQDVDRDFWAFVRGLRSRLQEDSTSDAFDVVAERDELVDRVNATSEDVVQWANARELDPGVSSMAVEIHQGDDRADLMLTANYDGTEWTSFGATTHVNTPEERSRLSGPAARNAVEEYDRFHEEFVVPGEPISGEYVSEMAGKYYWNDDHVASTLLGDDL